MLVMLWMQVLFATYLQRQACAACQGGHYQQQVKVSGLSAEIATVFCDGCSSMLLLLSCFNTVFQPGLDSAKQVLQVSQQVVAQTAHQPAVSGQVMQTQSVYLKQVLAAGQWLIQQ